MNLPDGVALLVRKLNEGNGQFITPIGDVYKWDTVVNGKPLSDWKALLDTAAQRRNNVVWAARNGIAPDESYTKDEVALWEYVRRTT